MEQTTGRRLLVLPLYASLPTEQQSRVFLHPAEALAADGTPLKPTRKWCVRRFPLCV